jgi:hypothetical protein
MSPAARRWHDGERGDVDAARPKRCADFRSRANADSGSSCLASFAGARSSNSFDSRSIAAFTAPALATSPGSGSIATDCRAVGNLIITEPWRRD